MNSSFKLFGYTWSLVPFNYFLQFLLWKRKASYSAQLAHNSGTYLTLSSFVSVAWSGLPRTPPPLPPIPPGGDVCPPQASPTNCDKSSQQFVGTHLYSWVERGTVRVECLAQEHNTITLARSLTWNTQSGIQRTNHKRNALLTFLIIIIILNIAKTYAFPH